MSEMDTDVNGNLTESQSAQPQSWDRTTREDRASPARPTLSLGTGILADPSDGAPASQGDPLSANSAARLTGSAMTSFSGSPDFL